MNLQQLYYFDTLYQVKNYTHAAKKLMITQSSLSHSISDLEKELGVPLFYRVNRTMYATEYAEKFERHVKTIINELEIANAELEEEKNPNTGLVRIGMSNTLSLEFMPSMIRKFKQHPENRNIRFHWEEMTAHYVNEALKDGSIDLGFGAKIEDDEIEFRKVTEDEVALIVPRSHPFTGKDSVSFKQLETEPFITFPYTCGTRYFIDEIINTHDLEFTQIQELPTEKLIAGMVASGGGVAIIPVLRDLYLYDVVQVPIEGGLPKRPMFMEWTKTGYMKPVVKHFRKFVMDTVGE